MVNDQTIQVVPSGAALGADIVGVDLREELTPERFAEILKAWDEHLVLRFRGQDLSEDQFVRFSSYFGGLDKAPTRPVNGSYHPTREEIAVISNIVKTLIRSYGITI